MMPSGRPVVYLLSFPLRKLCLITVCLYFNDIVTAEEQENSGGKALRSILMLGGIKEQEKRNVIRHDKRFTAVDFA